MARPDSWFRLYNGVVDNPKVQRLPAALFKVWINLLCVASRHGGALPALADVAFILRVKETQARAWMAALESHGLFDRTPGGALMPHDWNSLQYKSDVSTERVKRHRERKAQQAAQPAAQPNETVAVTPPEQSRPDQSTAESPESPPGGGDAEEVQESFSENFSEDFLAFWKAYPEKVGQRAAWRAWQTVTARPALAELLAAVERYARTKPADRAWCNPSTWLRQGRWNDVRAAEARDEGARRTVKVGGRTEDQWRWGVRMFTEKKYWPPSYGPKPGESGCACPRAVLAAFNLVP